MVFAVGQQRQHLVYRFAGFVGVAGGHGTGPHVEHVGVLAQLGAVAGDIAPRRVDHQRGVFRHFHRIAGHGDQAGDAGGDAVDAGGDMRRMALDGVVDGDAVGNRTAVAIDAQGDGVHIQCGDVAHEIRSRHRFAPPRFADVAVDKQLGAAIGAGTNDVG